MGTFDKFFDYFKENMRAMGWPTPEELYGNLGLASATVKELIQVVEKYGTKVTVKEMIIAGKLSERYKFVETVVVSYYAGCVIGSLLIALQRCLCKGKTLADLVSAANVEGLYTGWLYDVLLRYPGIYDETYLARSSYALQMGHYA